MFIAHLPAGYLLTKAMLAKTVSPRRSLWFAGLFFSLAPDLDLAWFYLFSDRLAPHHQYVMHWPLFWVGLAALAWTLSLLLGHSGWRPYIKLALCNSLLHLLLDSVAAEIYWLAPFSSQALNLAHVPAAYGWWVWNFILHWTFLLELGICLSAVLLFIRARRVAGRAGMEPGFK